MDSFTNIMNSIDSIVWCMVLVVLCLGAGLYFSIRMKFPQVRLIKEMARLLVAGEKSESGITPFQAFAATVGSRVGMGNIAGVATAIFFGGPGAVFWMWCIAFIGASSAFIEISWGVKRGIYSNEAGQGSGAIVSAAAECSHPAKQGLVQAFSVYIDTLIVCTASALIILLTGTFNVVSADGTTMLTENVPGLLYGIRWAQTALMTAYGTWAGKLLAIVIIMFVFTSLMGYYYQAESNIRYLTKENKAALWAVRILFLVSAFSGCILNGEIIWTMGDIGCGSMAWLNIIAILLLSNKGIALLKDYEEQKKQGKNPVFNPEKFGIKDETHVWDKYSRQ